jgi:hypothetical protein
MKARLLFWVVFIVVATLSFIWAFSRMARK